VLDAIRLECPYVSHITAVASLVPSPSVPVFTQEHVATDDKVGHVYQTLAVLG